MDALWPSLAMTLDPGPASTGPSQLTCLLSLGFEELGERGMYVERAREPASPRPSFVRGRGL